MSADEIEAVRRAVEMIRMGADYTGLTPKTHAWVSMELLERIDDALRDRPEATQNP